MSSLFVLIPLGALFSAIGVWFFIAAVNSRQFEQLDELGRRLPDDEA
ncbi:MAG: Cytochrome oxidase maturation protein cbb3-type [Hydrocarboniphaga sp.]|nr:cbb3-type cytochrome oxidase assembly protein CcoS [Hydrocarboniphaga sp.]MDB5971358.1 Cytochrome oxidase maturation protein cbb3-type [Hydrocarboniphaga sp.]